MKVDVLSDDGLPENRRVVGERNFHLEEVQQVWSHKGVFPGPWLITLRHGETFHVSASDWNRVRQAFLDQGKL